MALLELCQSNLIYEDVARLEKCITENELINREISKIEAISIAKLCIIQTDSLDHFWLAVSNAWNDSLQSCKQNFQIIQQNIGHLHKMRDETNQMLQEIDSKEYNEKQLLRIKAHNLMFRKVYLETVYQLNNFWTNTFDDQAKEEESNETFDFESGWLMTSVTEAIKQVLTVVATTIGSKIISKPEPSETFDEIPSTNDSSNSNSQCLQLQIEYENWQKQANEYEKQLANVRKARQETRQMLNLQFPNYAKQKLTLSL